MADAAYAELTVKFQFHIGAIRRYEVWRHRDEKLSFNSILVQLEGDTNGQVALDVL